MYEQAGFYSAPMEIYKYIIIFQNLTFAFKELLSSLKYYLQTFKKTEVEVD